MKKDIPVPLIAAIVAVLVIVVIAIGYTQINQSSVRMPDAGGSPAKAAASAAAEPNPSQAIPAVPTNNPADHVPGS